jgi:hypothetical protein
MLGWESWDLVLTIAVGYAVGRLLCSLLSKIIAAALQVVLKRSPAARRWLRRQEFERERLRREVYPHAASRLDRS